jgi:hypothetical protein
MNQIDLRSISLAHRILLVGGVLLFIVMFFVWQGVEILGTSVGVSGWHGLNGVILGLLTIALVAWEVLTILGERTADLRRMVPAPQKLVSAGLAGAVLVFGVLKFLTANELRRWPEWVGLVLALAIGYGGWLAYNEGKDAAEVAEVPGT